MTQFVRGVLGLLLLFLPASVALAHPALIPMPVSMVQSDGEFRITQQTVVAGDGRAETAAYLAKALGLKQGKRGASRIRLQRVSDRIVPGAEAYRLSVTRAEVLIQASDPRGLFYGAQTLRQLITT